MRVARTIPAVHTYGMNGYQIEGSTIRFALADPARSGQAQRSFELVFREVEGYLFESKRDGNATLTVEEHRLLAFLRANEDYFAREARFGWPRFWQGSVDQTEGWLAYRGRRVWTVSTPHGLSGWIVAASAGYRNAASPVAERPLPLDAWRIPTPRWRP